MSEFTYKDNEKVALTIEKKGMENSVPFCFFTR